MIRFFMVVVALVEIVVFGQIFSSDETQSLFAIISCLSGILLFVGLYILQEDRSKKEIVPKQPNGEKPESLGRVLGIGSLMAGQWRRYADTYVGYQFFFFVLPLFPTGCYRYKILKSGVGTITYQFYGSEESSSREIFALYALFYGSIAWLFTSFMTFFLL